MKQNVVILCLTVEQHVVKSESVFCNIAKRAKMERTRTMQMSPYEETMPISMHSYKFSKQSWSTCHGLAGHDMKTAGLSHYSRKFL